MKECTLNKTSSANLKGAKLYTKQEFFIEFKDELISFAKLKIGSAASVIDPEDFYGTVFLKVYRHWPDDELKSLSTAKNFIYTVIKNAVIDEGKMRLRRAKNELANGESFVLHGTVHYHDDSVFWELYLETLMKRLPDHYAEVLELDWLGYTDEEIAEMLDKSVPAIKHMLVRARKQAKFLYHQSLP